MSDHCSRLQVDQVRFTPESPLLESNENAILEAYDEDFERYIFGGIDDEFTGDVSYFEEVVEVLGHSSRSSFTSLATT